MIHFKSHSWLALGVLVLVGAATAAPLARIPSTTDADEAAIRAQTTSWGKAYNGGDAAGVAAQYADDAVLLPSGAPAVHGRAVILAFFTTEIARSKAAGVVFNLDGKNDVGVSGNMGWESDTYTATIKGAIVESGKFLSVSRKKDGVWHYVRDTWNVDAPPAPAASPKT